HKAGGRRHALPARSTRRLPIGTWATWYPSTCSSRLSGGVAVAAPALEVLHPRALADFGDPQIEGPRLAQACKISDTVDRERGRKREEAAGDEEQLGRHGRVDDEKVVGHACEHLRPSERAVHGVPDQLHRRLSSRRRRTGCRRRSTRLRTG